MSNLECVGCGWAGTKYQVKWLRGQDRIGLSDAIGPLCPECGDACEVSERVTTIPCVGCKGTGEIVLRAPGEHLTAPCFICNGSGAG